MTIPVNRNPKFNPRINPRFNPRINPKFNSAINPKFNPRINPRFNPRINPKFNSAINPSFNPQINPQFNVSINPNLTANIKALLVYHIDSTPAFFAVNLPQNLGYIIFDYQLSIEGYCFCDGENGLVVYNKDMVVIGYWFSTEVGFNWFTINEEWLYFVV